MGINEFRQREINFVLGMIVILIGSCIFFNISLLFGFVGSILLTSAILMRKGRQLRQVTNMIYQGILECRMLYLLILLIGATVSVWLSSGVVPTMIYYGLQYMGGMNFLLAAFLITSIMAVFMGTAVGTVSTIGLALLGIGKGFGIPTHILLGAIISGAFIADKISPISGLLNLTLTATKTKYKETLKSMMVTFVPVYVITLASYYYIGSGYGVSTNLGSLIAYQSAILEGFYISPWLLLLPLGILFSSIMGIRTISTISMGLMAGVLVSVFLQNMSSSSVFHAIIWGYKSNTASGQLNNILISGGIASMVEVVSIVACAVSLSSVLERSGLIRPMINKMISTIESEKQLIVKTGITSSILTVVTCDQTVGIVLPGRLFAEKYKELGVSNSVLARTISDTGTVIAPLMPWNVNALIIGLISGIPAMAYAPYAVFCYVCPIISMMAGLRLKSKKYPKAKALG
ncbi:Na+/H+ antiporter NhaC [Alkaliphilus metalliredigens QYMF]|uniref:Na+/H+ antiporter NhaC n=1 Tax=Alkaliphilus metalliredigens (strain QYMF) TaxID=293826 RepID=A6TUF6_ALKMQ|nr:Na+/H+ antiporter NhaC family protein [Alkaliphilus metalliredigens]ABR49824.1 Na+/H+ antiporter NhaC [Alkaliphilus metalliredigens QYMF]